MSVTLTDAQWQGVQKAAEWYQFTRDLIDTQGYDKTVERWITNKYGESERQIDTVRVCDDLDPFVFAGYAGTGKSTCVGSMIENLGLTEDQVLYMAPTGKAAKVLSEKLRSDGWKTRAQTIHKTIYKPLTETEEQIAQEIERHVDHALFIQSDGKQGVESGNPEIRAMGTQELDAKITQLEITLAEHMDRGNGPQFDIRGHQDLPKDLRLFVVDEASMVGTDLVDDLRGFGLPILAVGDPGQLPPVKDTWGFEMQNPNVFLEEIHRQAKENPIIQLATRARKGLELKVGDYGDDVRVVQRKHDDATMDMDRDAMVLVGTNKKRWSLTSKIRKALHYTQSGPMEGEPLIVRRNSKEHPALVNGSLVECAEDTGELEKGRDRFKVKVIDTATADGKPVNYELTATQGMFEEHKARQKGAYTTSSSAAFKANKECHHLDFGHVLTVHNSQGSEFNEVVLHDESPVFRGDASRWLYTGITRASEKLTVVT